MFCHEGHMSCGKRQASRRNLLGWVTFCLPNSLILGEIGGCLPGVCRSRDSNENSVPPDPNSKRRSSGKLCAFYHHSHSIGDIRIGRHITPIEIERISFSEGSWQSKLHRQKTKITREMSIRKDDEEPWSGMRTRTHLQVMSLEEQRKLMAQQRVEMAIMKRDMASMKERMRKHSSETLKKRSSREAATVQIENIKCHPLLYRRFSSSCDDTRPCHRTTCQLMWTLFEHKDLWDDIISV